MMGSRQLVVAVETTGALGASWPLLFTEYVEKIIRAFVEESSAQKNASTHGEMALVAFNSHGQHSDFLYRQSGWTSSVDEFLKWFNSLNFGGGGFGEGAVAEALAEALMMCCPGPKLPAVPQQKHCLLIAASNPYRLSTPVLRPLVLFNANGQPEYQTEQWWSADADAVSKAFPACQVSLSVIAPRQLPSLRSIYNGARRNPRAAESGAEVSKQYPQHLILISEGFPEGKLAIRRAAVASNTAVATSTAAPTALAAKLEPLLNTPASAPPQPAAVRPMSVPTSAGSMLGRQPISNGATATSMDNQSLLHTNVASNVPLPMTHTTTSGISGADTMQTSDTSASIQAKVGPVGGNLSTLGLINNTLTQPHKMPGTTTLGSVANGGSAGLSGSNGNPMAPSSLAPGQATILAGTGNVLTGLGPVTSGTVGMNAGSGLSTMVGGTQNTNANINPSANTNLVGPGGNLVSNQLGLSAPPLQSGVGPIPVSGASQAQSNPLGVLAGIGGTTGALATAGVNAGVNTVMPPTSGLPQAVQSVPPLGPSPGIPAVVTPPQQPSGALKYTKLWEGILAGQRQQKPVPICKLEGYRQTSASEKLAADWPPTMQIVRLIAQEYMNSKEYQGKAELLVFRPLSQHGFLVQLAEKKLCAVIQLPSQTLLLASTDKPGRMIGMLFPGDMVIFKPNVSTSAQQPTGAVAPLAGTGQAIGQPLGQSNFTQGQLQGQMNPQQLNPQQMGAQQLNPQQMNPQQMNPQQQLNAQQMGVQQMNPQQMSVQQMNSQQMNSQQMSGQQINPQQMGVQQINPQMNMQQMGAQQMNPQQTRPQIMPGPVSLQGPGYNLP